MWKKNLIISLGLFLIFVGSAFLVHGGAMTSTISNTDSTNTVTNNLSPNGKLSQSDAGNILAYNYNDPGILIGDQAVSSIWKNVQGFDVPAYKADSLQGYIKVIHDSRYMYALIAFPSAAHWAGIEFDANTENPMQDGHDGWVFGNSTTFDSQFFGDVHFVGESMPQADVQKDISFERINDPSGLVMYEVQRALDTQDTAGKDVVFTPGTNITVRFASGYDASTHKGLNKDLYSFAVLSQDLVIQSQSTTSTSTSTTPIAVIKAENFNNILLWGSVGFFFNLILINMLIIYHRRSS